MTEGTAPHDEADRRRVIEGALSRRSNLSVAELQDLLHRRGVSVPAGTVLADLESLGHEVEDGDRVAVAMGEADLSRREARRRGLVPALVVLSLLLGLAAVLLAVSWIASGGASDGSPSASDRTEATSFGAGVSEAPDEVPEPDGDPEPDVMLTFAVDGFLPVSSAGDWDPGRGDWFARGGQAHTAAPGEEEAVTFFAAPGPDLEAEVTLPTASPGAGLAVRVADDADYLAWIVSPDGEAARLVRVEDAVQAVVTEVDDVAVAPGVVLGVRLRGAEVELTVDDEVVATEADPDGIGVGVGLVAIGTDVVSDFDDLRVTFA